MESSPSRRAAAFYPLDRAGAGELLIVANPDEESSLPYLLRLPSRCPRVWTAGTRPRTQRLCVFYPMPPDTWPEFDVVCPWPCESPRWWPVEVPGGGQLRSPLVAK